MKKSIILLTVMLGSVFSITAQDYVPLVREGVKWKCGMAIHNSYLSSTRFEPYTIYFKGDTIIGDYGYKNCLIIYDGFSDEISDNTVFGYIREDVVTKKVYFRNNLQYNARYHIVYNFLHESYITGDEVILYDFDDVTQCGALCEEQNLIVETEDVDIDGQTRKQYNIKYSDHSHFLSLIEGVGCIGNHPSPYFDNEGDLFYFFISGYITGGTDYIPVFYHLEDADGNIIYDAPSDPQDFDGIGKTIVNDIDAVEVVRYDVHGRRLTVPVPGINIIKMSDGTARKVITR